MTCFWKRRSRKLDKKTALRLLEKKCCSKKVIAHCKAVSKQAVKIAREVKRHGNKVDLDFVETASLLHDIGRSKTHDITHCIEGASILKDYPRYARVCMRHIGAGIDKSEARKLGLPPKSYIPKTIEEKIIAHADNTIEGNRIIPIEKTIMAYEKKLGKMHSSTKRVIRLDKQIKSLMKR